MKIIVDPHEVKIKTREKVNENEYKITKCEFEFSEEYTNDLVKVALFTNSAGTYKQYINNNECDIPAEILEKNESTILGVYSYKEENEELILRYSPEPIKFFISKGSYIENAENSEPITPTDKEQIEQAIANLEVDKQDKLIAGDNITIEDNVISATDTIYDDSEIRADISELENSKVDKVQGKGLSTNDYTNEEKSKLAELENYDDTELKADIADLQTNKADKSEIPDVSNFVTKSVDDLVNYYLKSDTYTKTEVNNLIGSIQQLHFEIVEELPSTGESSIIYLVPRSDSEESNVYDEYIYTNNSWEKIGSTDIDLSDYVTTTQLNTALNYKQNTIDNLHKLSSDLVDDTNNTNKFVTSAEKEKLANLKNYESAEYSWLYNNATKSSSLELMREINTAKTNKMIKEKSLSLMQTGDYFQHDATIKYHYSSSMLYAFYVNNTVDRGDSAYSKNAYVRLSRLGGGGSGNISYKESYDVAKKGDTIDGLTITSGCGVPNAVLSGDTLYLYWSCKLSDNQWYECYNTFDCINKTLGTPHRLNLGNSYFSCSNLVTNVELDFNEQISMNASIGDLNGVYYACVCSNNLLKNGIIIKSTDLINWQFVKEPSFIDITSNAIYEGAMAGFNDSLYLALRQKSENANNDTIPMILAKLDTEGNVLQNVLLPSVSSRPCFFKRGTTELYLTYPTEKRHNTVCLKIAENIIDSIPYQDIAISGNYVYIEPRTQNLQFLVYTAGTTGLVVSSMNGMQKTADNIMDEYASIPTNLSDLADDSTHRTVTDTEKAYWDSKVSQGEYLKTIAKKEATGSVVSITDGFDDLPVIDLTVGIEPKQAGSGTPSPTNIRALSGWESVKIARKGKNLLNLTNRVVNANSYNPQSTVAFDKKYVYTWYASSGYNVTKNNCSYSIVNNNVTITTTNASLGDNGYGIGFNVDVKPNTKYTISYLSTNGKTKMRPTFYDKNGKYISYTSDLTFTTPENAKYMIVCCYFSVSQSDIGTVITGVFSNIQLEAGETATTYEPYNTQSTEVTIDLGRTVYGGTLDVTTGLLTVEYNIVDMGTLTWVKDGTNHRFYTNTLTTLIKDQSTTWSDDLFCSMYKSIKTSGGTDDLFVTIYDDDTYRKIYVKDTNQDETSATDFKTYVTGQKIIYPIATTQTYQLDPVQINTLLGNNTVYADCGDSDLKYYADITEVLDELDNKVDDVQVNGTSIKVNGVANIPIAGSTVGVVKANISYGTFMNGDTLIVAKASTSDTTNEVKAGTSNYKPIVPANQEYAVFYGLAKASGDTTQKNSSNPVGTYTDTAKTKIREMIGVDGNNWEKLVDKTLQADSTTALAYTDYAYEGKFKKIMIQIRGTVDTNNANISFYRANSTTAYQVFGNVAKNTDTLYEFELEGKPYLQPTAIRDSSVELKVYNVSSNTWTMLFQGRAPVASTMDNITDLKITSNGNFLTGTRVVVWGLR